MRRSEADPDGARREMWLFVSNLYSAPAPDHAAAQAFYSTQVLDRIGIAAAVSDSAQGAAVIKQPLQACFGEASGMC
ncbi:hypothetical protein DLM46_05380 [Paraburkholderia lacunae]|uniref:Uncharacterized protein n=1 Tax=Paraburkholderia lacunae TaxID=2211104 RepID=A0A370NDN7_9BURK|nr:hypothetical protein DLM46_05380 [Paraburkholderia lacunae]